MVDRGPGKIGVLRPMAPPSRPSYQDLPNLKGKRPVREEINQWQDRLAGFVDRPALVDYAQKYAEHFVMERDDGIIEVRMHSAGGPAIYSLGLHNAWGQAWQEVGNDPCNEVVIFSGTGDAWIGGADPASFAQPFHEWSGDQAYELHYDGMKVVENLVTGIDVPTIGVVNGPGSTPSWHCSATSLWLQKTPSSPTGTSPPVRPRGTVFRWRSRRCLARSVPPTRSIPANGSVQRRRSTSGWSTKCCHVIVCFPGRARSPPRSCRSPGRSAA